MPKTKRVDLRSKVNPFFSIRYLDQLKLFYFISSWCIPEDTIQHGFNRHLR